MPIYVYIHYVYIHYKAIYAWRFCWVVCLHDISVRVRGDTKVAASYRDIVSFCLSCLSFGEEAFELRILGPG